MEKLTVKDPKFWNLFFEDRDHTGRYCVTSFRTGVKYAIEPMHDRNTRTEWGDVNPVTKRLTGTYGTKYRGSIDKEDSLITKENGFKNIVDLPKGTSPEGYIEWKDAQYPDKNSKL